MRSRFHTAPDQVRQAGFEPATRCLEGSRSIRLSYWRSVTIVHGVDHASATLRSQSARASDLNQYTERMLSALPASRFAVLSRHGRLIAVRSGPLLASGLHLRPPARSRSG